MSSVRYFNQTAPFWDFVANLEEQGSGNTPSAHRNGAETNHDGPFEWPEAWAGFPFGQVPRGDRHWTVPVPNRDGPPPAQAETGQEQVEEELPATSEDNEKAPEAGPSDPRGPPPPFAHWGPGHRHGHGHDHGHGHGHGHHGEPGAHRERRGAGRGRGCGGWGGRGGSRHFGGTRPWGGMGGFASMVDMFQDQLFGGNNGEGTGNKDGKNEDFTPDVDVFDTADNFVVHVSLPGAKKEDVGVNWDSEKSELAIAGVIYRPGDEELLKTLALDERKVGAFERKVRLGSRANPAQVDVDGIFARLEDGVLRIEVPKLDSGYVEIKKVDIE